MNKNDIITAVKYLDKFLNVKEFKGATVRMARNGNPYMYTGGFNIVFQLLLNTSKYALRVWHTPQKIMQERYEKIATYVSNLNLPYFSEFKHHPKSLLVANEWIDTSSMKWVEGSPLKDYIEKLISLSDRNGLINLADNFQKMIDDLHKYHISHGDLQHGNILVTNNGDLKLIDYDSLYIPELKGETEVVTGLKGYQHPARFKNKYATEKADFFSELIIYLSIIALSEDFSLWDKYKIKDTEVLLFEHNDFLDFKNSQIYNDLSQLSPKIVAFVKVLEFYLAKKSIDELEPFNDIFNLLFKDPEINFFTSTRTFIENNENNTVTIKWNTSYTNKVIISTIGSNLPPKGEKTITISKNTILELTAFNALNKTQKARISITVSNEPPKINKFTLDKNILKDHTPAILTWEVSGAKNINISKVGNNLKNNGSKNLFFKQDTDITIEAINYFGVNISKTIKLKVSKQPPKIKTFLSNFQFVLPNTEVCFSWNVIGSEEIELIDSNDNVIKTFTEKEGTYNHRILEPGTFKLKATSVFGYSAKKSFYIETIPLPLIKTLQVNTPNISLLTNLNLAELEIPDSLIETHNVNMNIPLTLEDINIDFQYNELTVSNLNFDQYNQEVLEIKEPEFSIGNNENKEVLSVRKITNNIKSKIKRILIK
jgi:predicted Ser/Thr protein kinase